MDIIRELIEKKQLLQNKDKETMTRFKELGVFYAFNEQGDFLASKRGYGYLVEDDKVISEFCWNGEKREELLEVKQELSMLYFLPVDIDIKKYDTKQYCKHLKYGIPLPVGFEVKEIVCEDDIFCIQPATNHDKVLGTFDTLRTALSMLESLYFNKGVSFYIINQGYFYYLAEDHKNYMEDQEKKRKKKLKNKGASRKAHQVVDQDDFFKNNYGDYELECTHQLWGKKVMIFALYEGKPEYISKALSDYASQLNYHIKWIDDNKEEIQNAILKEGMVELAQDWMEGCDQVEVDGQIYYELENGELFPYPITEQAFVESLQTEGINASCDDDIPKEVLFDMFFCTDPDFFACHSIEVFIRAVAEKKGWDYKISVNGLAG